MEKFKPVIPCIIVGLLVACIFEACRTTHLVQAKSVFSPLYTNSLKLPIKTYNFHQADTTKPKKVMTAKEREQYLSQIYQYNYDRYFAPEFKKLESRNDRLSTIVATQARSIQQLSVMYSDMRQRAIHSQDSMQRVINKLVSNQQDYWHTTSISEQRRIDEAVKQTNILKKVVSWLCAVTGAIVMSMFIVFFAVKILFNKTKQVIKLVEELN